MHRSRRVDLLQEPQPSTIHKMKRRRLHGACDACRQKKIRCNSAERPGNICTNCELSNIPCTHVIPHGPKKAERQQAFVESLQRRIRRLESYFHRVYPNQDIDHIVDTLLERGLEALPPISRDTSLPKSDESPNSDPITSPDNIVESASPDSVIPDESEDSEEEDLAHVSLAKHFNQLSLSAIDNRYFGPASGYMFGKIVSSVKNSVTGRRNVPDPERFRRHVYWDFRPWERTFTGLPEVLYAYPEPDLLQSLCTYYFERMNILFPVLHQPTFMKSLNMGQHHWDLSFGMTVLLVCALGSKYSHDPRVIAANDATGLSAGWDYFCQVPVHRKRLFYETTIYDLQYYCLATLYLVGTSIPHAAWNLLGIGMRCAIERGVHRRQELSRPTAEDELWKRTFWCLLYLDRMTSSFTGRPSVIADEEYDLEYPIECDDEFWDTGDPEKDFKQPPNKPSVMTAFVYSLKLHEILGFGVRNLYPTKKSKILSGLKNGEEWETRVVAEIDSSMNQWKDNLPHFLRWEPDQVNGVFFHQSVFLYACYYYTQIQIHRPYLTKKSSLSFPSLAICTNAARACTHVMEAAVTRGIHVLPDHIFAIYSSGMVITLNLWGLQKSGMAGNTTKDLKDLRISLGVLEELEKRWHVAGRLRDILSEASEASEYQPTSFTKHADGPAQDILASAMPIGNLLPMVAYNNNLSAVIPSNNNWHLDNLLLTEMGFMKENYAPISASTSLAPIGVSNNKTGPTHMIDPNTPLGDEAFMLWSDIPAAFSNEEWNAYLANMSHQLPTM